MDNELDWFVMDTRDEAYYTMDLVSFVTEPGFMAEGATITSSDGKVIKISEMIEEKTTFSPKLDIAFQFRDEKRAQDFIDETVDQLRTDLDKRRKPYLIPKGIDMKKKKEEELAEIEKYTGTIKPGSILSFKDKYILVIQIEGIADWAKNGPGFKLLSLKNMKLIGGHWSVKQLSDHIKEGVMTVCDDMEVVVRKKEM